jgi:hypothetical protein
LNDSDGSERTSSDRTFSDYDLAIVDRLQYLTQRVEDLERKLEQSRPIESEDLSFGLSVNSNCSIPNVDIKVLAGPREPYYNSTGDEDLMGGWDDAIVERNTSFLIIPVGHDKDLQLNEAQRLNQTIDGALEPTSSLPALCCADTYGEIIDADESKESLEVNKSEATLFLTDGAISVSVRPSATVTAEETVESETLASLISDSSSIKSEEFTTNGMRLKISPTDEKRFVKEKQMEGPEIIGQKVMEKMFRNTEKLDASSRDQIPQKDGSLKYGYTISMAGVSPKQIDDRVNTLPFQPRVFNFESNYSLEQDGKDITQDRGGSENNIVCQDVLEEGKTLSSSSPSYVIKSTILPTSKSVCYEDVGIHEIYERNVDERCRLNRNGETRYKCGERDDVCTDRPIRIAPGLSKHDILNQNFIKPHTCNSYHIDKQLKDSERAINRLKINAIESELVINGAKDDGVSCDDLSIEKEVEEITSRGQNRLEGSMVTRGNEEKDRMEMQIKASRLPGCEDSYCPGNGTDEACVLGNNTTAGNGLVNNNAEDNTNHFKEIAVDCFAVNDLQNNELQRNTRIGINKTLKKVRVRSLELPLTSSEEDLSSMIIGDATTPMTNTRNARPQRRKQRNKTTKALTANMFSNEPVQSLERQLKDLIDPGEIGNLHEELAAANRPLLLAVMSPTDSGYVGSNADSPRDAWKEHYDSAYSNGLSTPVNPRVTMQPPNKEDLNPSYPSSLRSSLTSVTPINGRVDSARDARRQERQEDVFLSPRSAYHSMGNHSSASSTVSYIGGSDYSELSYSEDRDAFSDLTMPSLQLNHEITRLSDYFPGPTRLPFDNHSSHVRLNEYLLNKQPIASPTSSVATSDLSDSFFGCESDFCECQTGIATQQDFREELKSTSRYVLEARAKTGVMKKSSKSLKKYFLDEEQGEMDIFGAKLQKGEHKAVPMLVKVILRLRKHFFGGIEGPNSLKSLSPRQEKGTVESETRERKISFSPSAMLLSAVGESSASEIRDVIEKDRLDVNQLSPSGKSLLHKAAASGDLESIHTLIQYGARVNLTDQDGFAPVHSALRRCHYKCAMFLIECGTDMGAYTRTRIQELSIIKNTSSEYMKTVLNTPL